MIVVPVLMTNCQVSEKPKIGPVIAQTTITSTASINVVARPAASDVLFAASPNNSAILLGVLRPLVCRDFRFKGSTIPTVSLQATTQHFSQRNVPQFGT